MGARGQRPEVLFSRRGASGTLSDTEPSRNTAFGEAGRSVIGHAMPTPAPKSELNADEKGLGKGSHSGSFPRTGSGAFSSPATATVPATKDSQRMSRLVQTELEVSVMGPQHTRSVMTIAVASVVTRHLSGKYLGRIW